MKKYICNFDCSCYGLGTEPVCSHCENGVLHSNCDDTWQRKCPNARLYVPYSLCVDDQHDELILRAPRPGFLACKSSSEAWQILLEKGIPEEMDLDHDLGLGDDIMILLNKIRDEWPGFPSPPKRIYVRSKNPTAFKKLESFFHSWAKTLNCDLPEVINSPIG